MELVLLIKVDFDGDIRRISMAVSEDAPASKKFEEIRSAVAQGFDVEESMLPRLKYKDEEGDICSLVEASVEDLLVFSQSGTMRLFASKTSAAPAKDAEAADANFAQQSAAVSMASSDLLSNSRPMAASSITHSNSRVSTACEEISRGKGGASTALCISTEEAPAPHTQDMQGVVELMAMGFSKDQAVLALEFAKGTLEVAVEHLVIGHQEDDARHKEHRKEFNTRRTHSTCTSSRVSPRTCLESKVRALPINVKQRLQKARAAAESCSSCIVSGVKQPKMQVGQEALQSDGLKRPLSLEATLKAMQPPMASVLMTNCRMDVFGKSARV